jgi:hypothetical protein
LSDVILEYFKQIRDGMRETNARIDQTRRELTQKLDRLLMMESDAAVSSVQDSVDAKLEAVARRLRTPPRFDDPGDSDLAKEVADLRRRVEVLETRR